ncbi:C-C motif chemokine 20-like [Pundamilia nyererei]|uniref:C-C motif chemokine n=2 Tax=Pundamilia nyererei TaxID=303518 RepID=A0A3B4FJA8_9CICH|nr:PREDICTED: C-C motif chemokine 20-like [Pundamilia nyererei]
MLPIRAVVVIALTVCLTANTSAAYRYCCRRYMRGRLQCSAIEGYSVQTVTEMCPINAIIFYTKKWKVCANPALRWVMNCVDRIRNRAQRIHQLSSL